MDLVFRDGHAAELIDRPVEMVYRGAQGLPKGNVKAVDRRVRRTRRRGVRGGDRAAHQRERGRGARRGRAAVPRARDQRVRSEDWLGEWTFLLNNGSMTDEPILLGTSDGQGRPADGRGVGRTVVHRTGVPGELPARRGVRRHPDRGRGGDRADGPGHHCCGRGAAPRRRERDRALRVRARRRGDQRRARRRSTGIRPGTWAPRSRPGSTSSCGTRTSGWIGLEQYDEANPVGQAFLDRYEGEYGHRPEYYSPLLWRDCAMSLLYAFADAAPLSPLGVKDALERVKMLPAACGSPGTRISFGRWMHRGWVGAGYMVARTLDPDGKERGDSGSRRWSGATASTESQPEGPVTPDGEVERAVEPGVRSARRGDRVQHPGCGRIDSRLVASGQHQCAVDVGGARR